MESSVGNDVGVIVGVGAGVRVKVGLGVAVGSGARVAVDVGNAAMTVGDVVGVDDNTRVVGDTTCPVGVTAIATSTGFEQLDKASNKATHTESSPQRVCMIVPGRAFMALIFKHCLTDGAARCIGGHTRAAFGAHRLIAVRAAIGAVGQLLVAAWALAG